MPPEKEEFDPTHMQMTVGDHLEELRAADPAGAGRAGGGGADLPGDGAAGGDDFLPAR